MFKTSITSPRPGTIVTERILLALGAVSVRYTRTVSLGASTQCESALAIVWDAARIRAALARLKPRPRSSGALMITEETHVDG